jgi:hypothetical protein
MESMDATQKKAIEKRLRLALELFDAGCEMMRQNLRRAHPDASEADIDEMFGEWLQTRPGAELGDAEGIPGKRRFNVTPHE